MIDFCPSCCQAPHIPGIGLAYSGLPLRAKLGANTRGDAALRHPHRNSVLSPRGFLCVAPAQGSPLQPQVQVFRSPRGIELRFYRFGIWLVSLRDRELSRLQAFEQRELSQCQPLIQRLSLLLAPQLGMPMGQTGAQAADRRRRSLF